MNGKRQLTLALYLLLLIATAQATGLFREISCWHWGEPPIVNNPGIVVPLLNRQNWFNPACFESGPLRYQRCK
jgi:hypothetical protein